MCIIIHKPAGVSLSLSTVLRAYQNNADGWGLIARSPQGLIIRRDFGPSADESLLDTFDEFRNLEVTLHCRIGTSGELSIRNTHPFPVRDGLWMFHNGVIQIDRGADPTLCDTHHVARALDDALGELGSAALRDPEYLSALTKYADTSRLVFVDNDGVIIINERLGYWDAGSWFSNDSSDSCPTSRLWDIDADYAGPDRERYGWASMTEMDDETLFLNALSLIDDARELDVEELTLRCVEEPEIAAEALFHLIHSAAPPRGLTSSL